MIKILIALLLFCQTALADTAPPASLGPLLTSIQQRLAIAGPVALSKWDSGKAVEDRSRERAVIAAANAMAVEYKVPGDWAEAFFSAQIEANKLLQYANLSQWHLHGKAPASPRADLVNTIRPQLDRLQITLLQQLAAFAPARSDSACPHWVAEHIETTVTDTLQRLAMIRASAPLCANSQP